MVCPNCQTRNIQNRVRCRQCNYPLFETTREERGVDYQQRSGETLDTIDIQEPVLEKDRNSYNLFYQEAQEEQPSVRKEQVTVDRSVTSVTLRKERGPMLGFVLFGASIVVAAFVIYFLGIRSTERSAQMLFAQAEELYIQESYFASRKIFERFTATFPQSNLSAMAYQRIQAIDDGLLLEEEQRIYRQKRLELLITQARGAFEKKNFLAPEGNNAFFFITEVLMLDPGNQDALTIRDQIVSHYDEQGAYAISQKRYFEAKACYEIILKLLPADPYALGELDRINMILEKPSASRSSISPTSSQNPSVKTESRQSDQEKRIEELRRKRQQYFENLRRKNSGD